MIWETGAVADAMMLFLWAIMALALLKKHPFIFQNPEQDEKKHCIH